MPKFSKTEANRILGRLVRVWATPGVGIRQIEDILDDLVRRVEIMRVSPNAFEPRQIRFKGKPIDPRPIIKLREQGMTFRQVSERLEIPASTIHKIYKNRHKYGVLAEHSYTTTDDVRNLEDIIEVEGKGPLW